MKLLEHEKIQLILAKFTQLKEREKIITLVTISALILIVCSIVIIEPSWKSMRDSHAGLNSAQEYNETLEENINSAQTRAKQDPNQPLRQSLKILSQDAKHLDDKIQLLTQALVPPKEMLSLLSSLVKKNKQSKIISLKNIPLEVVKLSTVNDINGEAEEGEDLVIEKSGTIYRHGLELTLKSSYLGVVEYLKEMEGLAWQIFVEDLTFSIKEYPNGILTMKVYTLSTSEEIIGV